MLVMMNKEKLISASYALLWVVVFQLVSAGIGYVTRLNIADWYMGLEKSAFNPPNYVFPIVWTALYVMIAVAGWRIFSLRDRAGAKPALLSYVIYVLLNWGWSFVFFAAHMIGAGFIWIVITVLVNAIFLKTSWRLSKLAFFLMIPPFLWGAFAGFLNYQIWVLN